MLVCYNGILSLGHHCVLIGSEGSANNALECPGGRHASIFKKIVNLGGGFKDFFIFTPKVGEDVQFD